MNPKRFDIPLHFLDSVDSTSTEAKTWRAPLPFAIAAAHQRQGYGQQAGGQRKTWHSPLHQGIYISFAFEPKDFESLAPYPGQLALRIGVFLSQWIDQRFQKKCVIKWPNDILWNGKKIAGILIENTLSPEPRTVLGLGINVFPSDFPDAASLLDGPAAGASEAEQTIRTLTTEWVDFVSQNLEPALASAYETCLASAIKKDDFFYFKPHSDSNQQSLVQLCAYNPDGSLVIRDTRTNDTTTLYSSQEQLRWVHQPPFKDLAHGRIGFLECGNTHFKLFREGHSESFQDLESVHQAAEKEELQGLYLIQTKQSEAFEGRFKIPSCRVPKKWLRTKRSCYQLEQIGIDRLLQIEGAMGREYPDSASVSEGAAFAVLSCGTAYTLDFVNADREHLGGWIFPSPYLMEQSLNALDLATPADPTIEPTIPTTTEEATGCGMQALLQGGLQHILRSLPAFQKLYLTGGDRARVQNILKSSFPHLQVTEVPVLLFEGAQAMVKNT